MSGGLKFTGGEWRILIAIVVAEDAPVRVLALSRRLKVQYSAAKRTVRGLVAWRIVERVGRAGVIFQADHTQWRPPPTA